MNPAAGAMSRGRGGHLSIRLYSGLVMVLGGGATTRWSSAGVLSAPLQGHAATLLHTGHVLVTGGSYAGSAVQTVQRYTP